MVEPTTHKTIDDEIAEIDKFFAIERARKDELRYGVESMKKVYASLAKIEQEFTKNNQVTRLLSKL
jgi:uncharacterized protein YfcZ (UPF0381/DUF406 family)